MPERKEYGQDDLKGRTVHLKVPGAPLKEWGPAFARAITSPCKIAPSSGGLYVTAIEDPKQFAVILGILQSIYPGLRVTLDPLGHNLAMEVRDAIREIRARFPL